MIPKQLFFIWLGDEQPDYINYAIKAYKDMNPDFKVDLIRYTKDEVIHTSDSVINTCKKYIDLTKKGIQNKYFDFIKYRMESKFNYIQLLSDFIRFELLYYYGGIYLDCDTFPIKKFDDKLLNNGSFAQHVIAIRTHNHKTKYLNEDYTKYYDYGFINHLTDYCIYEYPDIYFVGATKEYKDITFDIGIKCKGTDCPWIRNFENDKIFQKYMDDFYNQKLKLYKSHIFYTYYINHFCKRNWQKDYKSSPLYCELDDYLYNGN